MYNFLRNRGLWALVFCATVIFPADAQQVAAGSGNTIPWYVRTAAIFRVSLKEQNQFRKINRLSLHEPEASSQLRQWKEQGVESLEIFGPEDGGNSYNGLDARERYQLDPGIGSMADFRRIIRKAHALGMHVVTFQNLGYAATDASQFAKAEDDIRAGHDSREARMFLWSGKQDAPPPAKGSSYFLIRPGTPGYDAQKAEFWQWSERAHLYYWTKWPGKDESGQANHLPQFSWIGSAWPSEAKKVVNFWMSTGLDGMVVDAVNWYVGYDWKKNSELIAELDRTPGPQLTIPEGGGAFHTDDPVGWITDGKWTALYDYGLDIWWEPQSRPLLNSITNGDPGIFENALRSYHDRVVAAGGVLVQPVLDFGNPARQKFGEALLATSGDMLCYCGGREPAPGIPDLLKLKQTHPALFQNSVRRRIATDRDDRVYATVRDAHDRSERILTIFNFSDQPVSAVLDTAAINSTQARDIQSDEQVSFEPGGTKCELPANSWRLLVVQKPAGQKKGKP